MRGSAAIAALGAAALFALGCQAELRDGWYGCADARCPAGFACVNGLCQRVGGEMDAGPRDGSTERDAGPDAATDAAPPPDAPPTTDAGPDAAADAGLPCDGECEARLCVEGECVECLDEGDCPDTLPFCDTDARECGQCLTNEHCPDADRSVCERVDERNECVPCTETFGTDCDGVVDEGVLLPVCVGQVCRECVAEPGTGFSDFCPTNVCRPDHTCSEYEWWVGGQCAPCDTDWNCPPGEEACVPMVFDDVSIGSFCLPLGDECDQGFFDPFNEFREVVTVDDAIVQVCALATTSCPAYLDFGRSEPQCGDDDPSNCGAPGVEDARCVVDGSYCSYSCGDDTDCPHGGAVCEGEVCAG